MRERLLRIQHRRQNTPENDKPHEVSHTSIHSVGVPPQLSADGWTEAGYQTLSQVFSVKQHIPIPPVFFPAQGIVIPDLEYCINRNDNQDISPVSVENLLFFDLETTGLSGGAGTVAFLAAFGRLVLPGVQEKTGLPPRHDLRITQYLLLDYPGESDFLDAVTAEFSGNPLVVSYNGKSFDSQILKTRCLMNGIQPPQYLHADLLHPARRLWKRIIESCSQGNIEEKILGLDRSDDIPGALAPDIWFGFLRSGNTGALTGICEHNRRDIRGLASIFAVMAEIAQDPIGAYNQFPYDAENLALRWHDSMRYLTIRGMGNSSAENAELYKTGRILLQFAAEKGGGRAALLLAVQLLRSGFPEEGRKGLGDVAAGNFSVPLRASALRFLAIDSEHYRSDFTAALEYVNNALDLDLNEAQKMEFERRKSRLLKKAPTAESGEPV